jgi:hypothetical protein
MNTSQVGVAFRMAVDVILSINNILSALPGGQTIYGLNVSLQAQGSLQMVRRERRPCC